MISANTFNYTLQWEYLEHRFFKLTMPYRALGTAYCDERERPRVEQRPVRRLAQLGDLVNVQRAA